MDPSTLPTDSYDLPVDSGHTDAEAALAALRAAIGQPENDFATSTTSTEHDVNIVEPSSSGMPVSGLSTSQQIALERAMAALAQLSNSNQTIFDNLNIPGMLQGLAGSLELILKSEKRQAEIVRNLHAQLSSSAPGKFSSSNDVYGSWDFSTDC